MTPREISGEEALRLLEEVVKETGEDYVYREHWNSCQNFMGRHGATNASNNYVSIAEGESQDMPLCIAGKVYAKLGLKPSIHGGVFEGGTVPTVQARLAENPVKAPFLLSDAAVDILRAAQVRQDSGETYGAALRGATSRARVVLK